MAACAGLLPASYPIIVSCEFERTLTNSGTDDGCWDRLGILKLTIRLTAGLHTKPLSCCYSSRLAKPA